MRRVLALPMFRRLWAGASVSVLADGIVFVAIALYVQQLTGSARDTGVVLFAYTAPLVACLLAGGVVADRLPRQRVLVVSDLVRAGCHLLLAVLIATGAVEIWHMVAIGLAFGTAEAFFRPAFTGLLPQTVDEDLIQEANGVMAASREAAYFLAPGVATAMVLGLGPAEAFALDGALYVVSALLLGRVRGRARGEAVARTTALDELRQGWSAVRERAWVWATILVFSLSLLVMLAPFFALGAGVAAEVHGDAAIFGLFNVAFGIGTCSGALAGLRLRPRFPLRAAFLAALLWPGGVLAFAAGAPVAVVFAAAVIAGIGIGLFAVWWETALAQRIPPHLLGRVSAYDWMGSLALLPLGFLLAGPVGEALGEAATLTAGAVLAWVLMACGLLPRATRRLERLPGGRDEVVAEPQRSAAGHAMR